MNSEELRILIETARIKKGISQRELSKQTGISRSTLNDLINGKIKKVDIDDLRKIAEALDMSLQELVKVAGYDEMSMYFRMNKSQDKYLDKSTKDLKRLLDEYGIPCKGYNFLGLVLAIFNKKINRRKYYCSEFIYKILSDDSVKLFGKTKKIVKPMDFEKIENLKFVYEGKIIDYKLKKISTLNLFDKVI